MIDLSGRHVMVVGGSRGIGAAAARMAATAGAGVSVTYQSDGRSASRVMEQICEGGGRAVAYQADTSDAEVMSRVMDEAVATLGSLNGSSCPPASMPTRGCRWQTCLLTPGTGSWQ